MSSKPDKEAADEKKVGVYICHCGGNISNHVDVQQLAENVEDLPGVVVTHTNMFMCSDPGQELIQQDIKSGKINRVVVASCAPSLHELTFRNAIKRADMNPYLYEHANIREQVSWVHDGEKATHKATGLVSAAISKSKHLEALDPIRVNAANHATVIGGGVAGLRAALDLCRRGIEVVLVEKSPFLGGQASKLDKLYTTGENAGELIKQLADAVCADSRIKVFTCAKVIKSEGYVGNFKIIVKRRPPTSPADLAALDMLTEQNAGLGEFVPFAGYFPATIAADTREVELESGVIVFATGFQPYRPREGEYGYDIHPQVITLAELIRHMAAGTSDGDTLSIDGKKIGRVALIHCVGSRQIPGIHEERPDGTLNEYCSRTCCTATLQAACEIRERYPATHVFEYYRDIRTYGRGQEEYYERAGKNNVTFFRFEPENPPAVEAIENARHPLKIKVLDTLTFGEEIEAEVDLVVLAVGMEPHDIGDLVDMMKLPAGVDRFLQEVHPKLRPVELANTGILLAGTCQAPMDVGEACAGAQAASAKASTLLARGYVELDPFVAQVDLNRCSGAGKCVGVCPIDDAIVLVDTELAGKTVKRARVNPALCTGCGICVAVCPDNAVDIKGWTLKQYEEMVDAIVAA
ncbi:MAG: CoB--CoM heterodisulfide reductase iron-sulfur subunit A family protein [Deltaproteobacteria bacterium]|jgi:heterodisulfide reductase subunit A|nr:CoB--CoM heterodisulfide reductase iron-sulfur subunit A family protein [Deltaproteobacteria bacterium]